MTVSARPRKRSRARTHDAGDFRQHISWDAHLGFLVERLYAIRSRAELLREDHLSSVLEIEHRIAVHQTAARVAEKVRSPPILERAIDPFVTGVKAEPPKVSANKSEPPQLPAMLLLLEADTPEKAIQEQSIIARAQAINRKNAELARERLPKQPEAQRNKTYHDYFLDEIVWMATDFREERKFKIQLARKISRMVFHYHIQKGRREARAEHEEVHRLRRLASSLSRDVRKFWNQIGEIAEYRTSLVEEKRQAKERKHELKHFVQRTSLYTRKMAQLLQAAPTARDKSHQLDVKQGMLTEKETKSSRTSNSGFEAIRHHTMQPTVLIEGSIHDPSPEKKSVVDAAKVRDDNIEEIVAPAANGSPGDRRVDDETTLIAAKRHESNGLLELENLQTQDSLTVEKLLVSQGIGPAVYNADREDDLEAVIDCSDEELFDSSCGDDDERTMREADADEEDVSKECNRLTGDNEMSVEELLRVQGIDPKTYHSDKRTYLNSDSDNEGMADEDRTAPNRNGNAESKSIRSSSLNDEGEVLVVKARTDLKDCEHTTDTKQEAQAKDRLPVASHSISESVVEVPSLLLRGALRDYQRAGMEWLVSLYRQNMNGILADEMGLGKTIQTIALLAWLAAEKGIWGPHLIIVPTSVLVNWEVECKKWLPGFKVLTYFGSLKERKRKRTGWTKSNSFHLCITSYKLAVQDATILRRKRWHYLILDEAHNIKNFNSQRWQTLLHFNSERRLLITGTPLQNSVMELWSLMHFVTPNIFNSHSEFQDWFSKPCLEAAEAQGERSVERMKIIQDLHRVLRPFMLRRLKSEVENSLPPKFEHVIKCHLSKRQRQLYEDFISRSDIRETLLSGDYVGMLNVLMQLRKVCNHPDLFEGRPIVSPLALPAVFYPIPTSVVRMFVPRAGERLNLRLLCLNLSDSELSWSGAWGSDEASRISAESAMNSTVAWLEKDAAKLQCSIFLSDAAVEAKKRASNFRCAAMQHMMLINALRLRERALLGEDLRQIVKLTPSTLSESIRAGLSSHAPFLSVHTANLCRTFEQVAQNGREASEPFLCCTTKASVPVVEMRYQGDDMAHRAHIESLCELGNTTSDCSYYFRSFDIKSMVAIPDARLIQWDCGKLQILDRLIRKLRLQGSRALIFTQMTKVLDILESFLSLHSLLYLRLDGTTKANQRQRVVERFNTDKRIFCMILTTRAGGIGLNLTGADTVIFYDTDYNPAIDNQAQDRAHRIGQTKPVHVYRLVSEQTIEEYILRRANEKKSLESLVISDAGFTTDAFRERAQFALPVTLRNEGKGKQIGTYAEKKPNGRLSEQGKRKKQVPLLDGVSGPFTGFTTPCIGKRSDQEIFQKGQHQLAAKFDEYQTATAALLAEEDEQERIAQLTKQQEEKELRAEFEESSGDERSDCISSRHAKSVLSSYIELKSSLTPIQLYALRLIENFDESAVDTVNMEMSAESLPISEVLGELGKSKGPQDFGGIPNDDCEVQDGLFYDVILSEEGQANYLKELTDADADINLYLPLRDGGPEELKVSSVVSGTAAAGLECAEDAAFFPHAYNRMSRTPYATRRQREKCIAIQRKRRAEKENEARRQRDLQEACTPKSSAEALPGDRAAVFSANSNAAVFGGRSIEENGDIPRTLSVQGTRRNGTKGKCALSGAAYNTQDAIPSMSMGLFKRSSKKNAKRLTLAGAKSSVGPSSSVMKGGSIGLNDGWTREEDQALLSAAADFHNNMLLAADILGGDPIAGAGIRQLRGPTHCLERFLTCQRKDKNTPPAIKAILSDQDLFRKHQKAMQGYIHRGRRRPYPWVILHPIPSDIHASHRRAMAQALSRMPQIFSKKTLPPFETLLKSLDVPQHFKPGFKTTETTLQALKKTRFPFMRPPRDDPRSFLHRNGQLGRYNTTQNSMGKGGQKVVAKASVKSNCHSQALSRSTPSQGRGNQSSLPAVLAKGKPDTGRGSVGNNTKVSMPNGPQSYSSSRKAYYVPGTAGRMSIGHYGSTVQSIPNATLCKASKTEAMRKPHNVRVPTSLLRFGVVPKGAGIIGQAPAKGERMQNTAPVQVGTTHANGIAHNIHLASRMGSSSSREMAGKGKLQLLSTIPATQNAGGYQAHRVVHGVASNAIMGGTAATSLVRTGGGNSSLKFAATLNVKAQTSGNCNDLDHMPVVGHAAYGPAQGVASSGQVSPISSPKPIFQKDRQQVDAGASSTAAHPKKDGR